MSKRRMNLNGKQNILSADDERVEIRKEFGGANLVGHCL
jgi:hypothetical protein